MSDEAPLLRAVLAAPDDDRPRLVHADWLEDHDQPERAELVRVQCALARLPFDDDRVSALQAREYRLLSRHLSDWREGLPYVDFHRGYLETLRWWHPLSFVDAGDLLERHPVRDVELGAQDEPGWGLEVAECPHLARVEMLRLTQMRSHFTDPSDFLAILSSPHLTGTTALDASGGHGYGDAVLVELLGLPAVRGLHTLSLDEMGLTDEGVVALAGSPLARTLTRLALSDNDGITAAGIRALIDSPLWPRLEELDLGGIRFGDAEAMRLVCGALPRSRLRRLGLMSAGRWPAVELCTALGSTSWGALEGLDLSWNQLHGDGLRLLLACPQLRGLRWLKLSHCALSDDDVARLADCPHLAGLTALWLSGNPLTDAGLEALARSPHLRPVYLGCECYTVGDAGVVAFASSASASRLRTWILPGSSGDEALQAIARSPHLGRLTTLTFGGRSTDDPVPTDAGAVALARSEVLPHLAFVGRHWDGLTADGLNALSECERLAWFGWSSLEHQVPELRARRTVRFGDFNDSDLFLGEPECFFPWSKYSFT